MKIKILAWASAAFLVSVNAMAAATSKDQSEAKIGSDKFTISGTAQWITSPGTNDSIRIDYTVKKNGSVMFPTDDKGGTLFSCFFGNLQSPGNLPKRFFQPIEVDGKFQGWMVQGLGICGNTTSVKFHLVFPSMSTPKGNRPLYAIRELVAKTLPQFKKIGSELTIWTIYQEWGNGGTSGSFFVPRKFTYVADDSHPYIAPTPVGSKLSDWPDFGPDFQIQHYPNIFTAGILDQDPDLIRLAADQFFKDDKESLELYGWIGVPNSKTKAKKAADALAELKPYLSVFHSR